MEPEKQSELTRRFEKGFDDCERMIQAISNGSEPRDKLDEAKEILKTLDHLLEEIEKEAATSTEEKATLESQARMLRKKYNSLVQAIMKEDSVQSYDNEGNPVFRRRSDLLFEDRNPEEPTAAEPNSEESSEEFEDKPEEIEAYKRNNNLEKILIVCAAASFILFITGYLLIHFLM